MASNNWVIQNNEPSTEILLFWPSRWMLILLYMFVNFGNLCLSSSAIYLVVADGSCRLYVPTVVMQICDPHWLHIQPVFGWSLLHLKSIWCVSSSHDLVYISIFKQIEGAFIQGLGWVALEELKWGDAAHKWIPPGCLYTCGPGSYKIPSLNDVPFRFNVSLLKVHSTNCFSINFRKKLLECIWCEKFSLNKGLITATVHVIFNFNKSVPKTLNGLVLVVHFSDM